MMIDAISTTRALPWPTSVPRRHARRALLAPGTQARAAVRHGLRGAVQTMCLSAAMMAAMGALGASRGPVELQQPAPAQQHTAALVGAGAASQVSTGVAAGVPSR
jgi:hypothetical protein